MFPSVLSSTLLLLSTPPPDEVVVLTSSPVLLLSQAIVVLLFVFQLYRRREWFSLIVGFLAGVLAICLLLGEDPVETAARGWAELAPRSQAEYQPKLTVERSMVVTASALNVRQGPSTDYEVLFTLARGEEVYCVNCGPEINLPGGATGRWCQLMVSSRSRVGFAWDGYLELMEEELVGPP